MVVAHGGLLHFLTEDWEDGSVYTGMYATHPGKEHDGQSYRRV